jgi:hypothetical protein
MILANSLLTPGAGKVQCHVESSTTGIISALRAAGPPEHFRGVAIYASFTTDQAKWSVYDRLWRGVEPVTSTPPPDPRNTTPDPPAR